MPVQPTPARHVVAGAGPVGTRLALALAGRGDEVVLVSRSGRGPDHERVRRLALDVAADHRSGTGALADAVRGASTLVNAVNPAYHRWPQEWPGLTAALLDAVEAGGARYVAFSNLYGYGPRTAPMTEDAPLAAAPGTKGAVRARTWLDALARHEAGRLRASEVRASDYFGGGPGANSHLDLEVVPRAARGRVPWALLGDPAAPHAWTFLPDAVTTLLAVVDDERADGRAWLVPSAARSMHEVAADVARLRGVRPHRVRVAPRPLLRAAARVSASVAAVEAERWQFAAPFLVDSTRTEQVLGVRATPWEDALRADLELLGLPARAPRPVPVA
ncbi:NAD-dependent epimerase/dehydratase family protein [Kineococcus sp. SYSU DK004]|uniref:NAD-dependent epimerase/dehydratase family protein n=1 Tax=Kineococcus sp. SYSU DK004 TaxID=3383125 RepID=UPI003D7D5E79